MKSLLKLTDFLGTYKMLIAHIRENFRSAFYPRMSEWACALMIFNWGVILRYNETVMSLNPSFDGMLQVAQQSTWSTACIWLGGLRLTVLLINGAWRRSPHLRGITAFLCIFIWFQVVLSVSQTFGTGMAVYPVILLTELLNVMRSFQDARLVDDAFGGGTDGQRSS